MKAGVLIASTRCKNLKNKTIFTVEPSGNETPPKTTVKRKSRDSSSDQSESDVLSGPQITTLKSHAAARAAAEDGSGHQSQIDLLFGSNEKAVRISNNTASKGKNKKII